MRLDWWCSGTCQLPDRLGWLRQLLHRGFTGAVQAGVPGRNLGGGVDMVLGPAAGDRDVEVLAVQAAAGQDDPDVGGGSLGAVNRGGPPVLAVPGQVPGRQGGGPAAA